MPTATQDWPVKKLWAHILPAVYACQWGVTVRRTAAYEAVHTQCLSVSGRNKPAPRDSPHSTATFSRAGSVFQRGRDDSGSCRLDARGIERAFLTGQVVVRGA